MRTQMIATITAAAIAFTGMSATTASANSGGEFARFVVGATVLAIIANEVNKSSTPAAPAAHVHTHKTKVVVKPRVAHVVNPPQKCLRQRHSSRGWVKFYGHNCLAKAGYYGNHRHW